MTVNFLYLSLGDCIFQLQSESDEFCVYYYHTTTATATATTTITTTTTIVNITF
jgi:hypothetical protein